MIRAGIEATDGLLALYHVPVFKALDPLDPTDFDKIVATIAGKLRGKATPVQVRFVNRALRELDVDWPNLSDAAQGRVFAAANRALAPMPQAVTNATIPIIRSSTTDVVGRTKRATVRRFKLRIKDDLTVADRDVVRGVAGMQANFVTDSMGKVMTGTSGEARRIVADGLRKGASRSDIAEALEKGLKAKGVGRSSFYWEVLAAAYSNRARTHSQLVSYREAQIDTYVWVSVIDKKTTPICRYMDQRTFEVSRAIERLEESESATDPAAVKQIQPWVREAKRDDGFTDLFVETGKGRRKIASFDTTATGKTRFRDGGLKEDALANLGVQIPPLHGLCRSTVVANV